MAKVNAIRLIDSELRQDDKIASICSGKVNLCAFVILNLFQNLVALRHSQFC